MRRQRRFHYRRCAAPTVFALAAMMIVGLSAAPAKATVVSRSVAYVFDDAQFPCDANGCGMNDTSGPGSGASIFANALTGSVPGNGNTGTYTPATGTLNSVNLTNVPLSALNADPNALAGYDTAIVYQTCDIGSATNANALSSLNAFVNKGGKLMIFDADACAPSARGQADWSHFIFPFATNSPGPQSASGSYDTVVPSSLTAGLSAGPQPDDSVGDANVFTTYGGAWFSSIVATNLNTTGIVQAYAATASGGLAIYDGEDFWFTDGPTSHLQLVFDNILSQPWNPSGLPNTVSASGITLSAASTSVVAGHTVKVTASVADALGNPQAGVAVALHVVGGPDVGAKMSGTTASNGEYVFPFTPAKSVGTDSLSASYVDSAGQTHTSNSVSIVVLPAPPITRAIVFVSGLDSTQAFSDSSSFARGCTTGTWGALASGVAARVRGDFQVFDAPVDAGSHPVPDCGRVQAHPPTDVHLDTKDFSDQNVDGTRLLIFLGWLHRHYGIDDVWLVGHSYGGIWSRSALTELAAGPHPVLHIDGIITVGTPHTGSFGADAYAAAASDCTFAFFSGSRALACGAALAVRAFFGDAVNGLTHASLTAWNASQTQQTTWGCVPIATIAGTEFTVPYLGGLGPFAYVVPNDVIVGVQSANGTGPGSSITRLVHLFDAKMVHIGVPFDRSAIVETSSRATRVRDAIISTASAPVPYEARCPRPVASAGDLASAAAAHGPHRAYVVALTAVTDIRPAKSALPRIPAGTVLLADGSTTARCGAKPTAALPLLGLRQFKLIFAPRCRRPLHVTFRGPHRLAALIQSRASVVLTVVARGRLALTQRAFPSAARVTLILQRPGKRTVVALGRRRRVVIRVRPARYQIQIVARLRGTTLVGAVTIPVT